MANPDSIRGRIESRLTALKKSSRAVSLELGLNTHFLGKYINGTSRSITAENLIALAPILQTSPEWLLTGRSYDGTPLEAQELIALYMDMTAGERATLIDFARFTLMRDS